MMKHLHRIAAGLTACAMLLSGVPLLPELAADYSITASAEDTYTEGTYDVLIYQNYGEYIVITGCDSSAVDVEIPGEIDGVPVTSIGGAAFDDCTNLTSVIIPDSVTSIGGWAFSWCTSLISVSIPGSVTSIGEWAFYQCKSLTSVTIPDSVTTIRYLAFYYCTSLTSVTIPDSVTTIGGGAFGGCTSLTEINVTDGNTSYMDIDGVLYNADCTELVAYPAGRGTAYSIPDGVTSIGLYAFSGCTNLTSVTIPDSVTSIGEWAFSRCTNLTSVTIPDSVTSIQYGAFSGCTNLTSVTIPDSVTSIGYSAFYSCESLTSVTIPDSVTTIEDGAFGGCTSLTEINVTDGNTSYMDIDGVLYNADCTELVAYPAGRGTDYSIPDGVTSIGQCAFSGCTNLTSVTIPDGVTSIGQDAFYWCISLTSVTIPDSVTNIYDYAFNDCTSLTDVYYSGTEKEWNMISIGDGNDALLNATIHFNPIGSVLYGDIDGDGEVTIVDVIELSQFLMGSGTLTAQGTANADVDQNGSLNSTDTLYIVQYLVKLLPSLPV